MARGKMKANVQRLLDERNRLVGEVQALKHRIEGLEMAIALLEKEDDEPAKPTSGRGKAKELLLDLLREVGTTGLNATTAVEIAARRGARLARGTAASTLSRLKADGIVTHENDRYRLREFTRATVSHHAGGGTNGTIMGVAAISTAGTLRSS